MKTLLAILLFTLTISAQEQQKVIVLDSMRKVVKFDVKKKNLEKTLDSLKGRRFYIIDRHKGKDRECLYIKGKGRAVRFYL